MAKSNISLTPEQKDQVRKLVRSFIGESGDERGAREGCGLGGGGCGVFCFGGFCLEMGGGREEWEGGRIGRGF
jgi:hypothetical protein